MKVKFILLGTALTMGGYYVGKVVGCVKTIKMVFDTFEEEFPGVKKDVVKRSANKIIDIVFDD